MHLNLKITVLMPEQHLRASLHNLFGERHYQRTGRAKREIEEAMSVEYGRQPRHLEGTAILIQK